MRDNTATETTQTTQDGAAASRDELTPLVSTEGMRDHGDEPSNLASPEEFFAKLTERSDVRDFLERLANR